MNLATVKLRAGRWSEEKEVLDRATGKVLGTVRKRSPFGLVSWQALDENGVQIVNPVMDGGRWDTRQVAVAQIVARHTGETAPRNAFEARSMLD